MADSLGAVDERSEPRADSPKSVTLREYLTQAIGECERGAAQHHANAVRLEGQMVAYRDLLTRLGPEEVPPAA